MDGLAATTFRSLGGLVLALGWTRLLPERALMARWIEAAGILAVVETVVFATCDLTWVVGFTKRGRRWAQCAHRVVFTRSYCSGIRRGAAAQSTCHPRLSSSAYVVAIAQIALDQKVEGSNPSSPANAPAYACFVMACPKCGADNPDSATFCSSCGTKLRRGSPAREERKIVSVLFVDLVGFTARSDRADPEDIRDLLHVHH